MVHDSRRNPRAHAAYLLAVVALAAAVPPAWARQVAPVTVRGVVRSADGLPVPFATVALQPGHAPRFTDDSGRFAFERVPPGPYHLVARQVGFHPDDTTLVVAQGRSLAVTVALEPIELELAAIRVEVTRGCTAPGPPDSAASPELTVLFDQLRENAARYRMMTEAYPFRFRMARTFVNYDASGAVADSASDTVRYLSSALAGYRTGQVITWGRGQGRTVSLVLTLPSLADFADSAFEASHCFTYEGVVQEDGRPMVRFHFEPALSIRTPDIEGDVDLVPESYQVRTAVIRLTHPGRAIEGLSKASSVITYAQLYPNILVQSRIASEHEPVYRDDLHPRVARYTEVQRLVGVAFEHPLPGTRPLGQLSRAEAPEGGLRALPLGDGM